MRLLILSLAVFSFMSCKNENKSSESVTEVAEELKTVQSYGEDFAAAEKVLSVGEAMQALQDSDSLMADVEGYVTSVCQVKGCWMVLSETPDDSTGLFVRFKDYGFFVPLDFAGSKATVRGKVYNELTSVDELRHYAEDEGQTPEQIAAITEPEIEKKVMASGVIVRE